MSKLILPNELAEIVTGLLIKPNLLGELDSIERHQNFMMDIARVIADHCGGDVNGTNPSEAVEGYMTDAYSAPYVSIGPNDSLPSLNSNVWAAYDPDGWEEEIIEAMAEDADSVGEPMSKDKAIQLRGELQQLLLVTADQFDQDTGNPKNPSSISAGADLNRVVVLVKGGLVQAVFANGDSNSVTVIDRDNELAGDPVQDLEEATEGLHSIY